MRIYVFNGKNKLLGKFGCRRSRPGFDYFATNYKLLFKLNFTPFLYHPESKLAVKIKPTKKNHKIPTKLTSPNEDINDNNVADPTPLRNEDRKLTSKNDLYDDHEHQHASHQGMQPDTIIDTKSPPSEPLTPIQINNRKFHNVRY